MYCWKCGGQNLTKESSSQGSDGYIVGECFERDIETADLVGCYRCDDCSAVSWITEDVQ